MLPPAEASSIIARRNLTELVLPRRTMRIAYHCLETYGIETTSPRVAIHSFAGCALYGAFVAKVIVVRSRRLPGWLLPAVGALLVLGVALLWYTAALWALNGNSVPGLSSV
ncbi:DUF6529 family protein [Streptomyces anulatus]|nr:DUF6529 family protein [Streptomyces anulatus]